MKSWSVPTPGSAPSAIQRASREPLGSNRASKPAMAPVVPVTRLTGVPAGPTMAFGATPAGPWLAEAEVAGAGLVGDPGCVGASSGVDQPSSTSRPVAGTQPVP